jgi:hypothetical protein
MDDSWSLVDSSLIGIRARAKPRSLFFTLAFRVAGRAIFERYAEPRDIRLFGFRVLGARSGGIECYDLMTVG